MNPFRAPGVLGRKGMCSFLLTLFLGALNDNMFKMLVSLEFLAQAEQDGVRATGVALVGAVFMLPFLIASAHAGRLADRFSKRSVMIAAKLLEIVAMLLAVVALLGASPTGMLFVLFLMAFQSTLFGPAKYGALPEIFDETQLSRANGLVEGATFLAIILGSAVGGALHGLMGQSPGLLGLLLVALAVAGIVTSLGLPRVVAASPKTSLAVHPGRELRAGLRAMSGSVRLIHPLLGIALFWYLGALVQMNLLLLARAVLGISGAGTGVLATAIALGIGVGSLLAGTLSGERIEPGLVPIGLALMAVACMVSSLAGLGAWGVGGALFILGLGGGLVSVPLYAMIQQRSPRQERGRILASVNVISTLAMLAASASLYLLQPFLGLSASAVQLFAGLLSLVACAEALRVAPRAFVGFVARAALRSVYRMRIVGRRNIPQKGPALLVANHLSYVDAGLVAACLQRSVRFLAYRGVCELPVLGKVLLWLHAIPVDATDRRSVVRAIRRARRELEAGEAVCVFAEGAISRDGRLGVFRPGIEAIARQLEIPVIPVRLDGLWGSVFSFSGGRAFWKLPRRIPCPVSVTFGAALSSVARADELREAIVALGKGTI